MKSIHKIVALGLLLFVMMGMSTTYDTEEKLLPSFGAKVLTMTEYVPTIGVYWHAWEDITKAPADPYDDGSGLPNWGPQWTIIMTENVDPSEYDPAK